MSLTSFKGFRSMGPWVAWGVEGHPLQGPILWEHVTALRGCRVSYTG